MSCPALGTEHECPKIGTDEECLIGGQLCSYVTNRFLDSVEIHIRRVTPRGVNDCDSFTTEGKGDIPDGYPMDCANCSNVADKEKCPYEPRLQTRTIKVGNTHKSDGSFGSDLGEWTVSHIIGHKERAT